MTMCIGSERYAFDFCARVTKLEPQPAEVIPIRRTK
jgi:hypothetical protein